MSNYFDNQEQWSWTVEDDKLSVYVDHGDHVHQPDLTNATFGDLCDNTGQTMGDAHRESEHESK